MQVKSKNDWTEKPSYLPKGEVHIWHASIDEIACQLDIPSSKLSNEELQRANRFYFETDKKRYIIGRGILRSIIGHYLKVAAGELQFISGRYGKPALSSPYSHEKLKFSMSHSNGHALYAFVREREVGIDIEHIRDIPEMGEIVDLFFSDTEKKAFCSLPEGSRKQLFFQIWTRKEAILKGMGTGLNQPLEKVDVLLTTDEIIGHSTGERKKHQPWRIEDLNLSEAYAAAYAIRGSSRTYLFRYDNSKL